MLAAATPPFRNLLVVIPNWVGDVVLATPTLAALRAHFADARITYLMRPYVSEIVAGCGWHDDERHWPKSVISTSDDCMVSLLADLRGERFDAALLLTNSFRSALVTRLARIPRRVGYARECRGLLLTDRLRPLKRAGEFVPLSVLPYYASIAEHIGCPVADRKLRLGIAPEQEHAAAELKRRYGLDAGRPYGIINPGAAFGAAKCWLPNRFAEVCDELASKHALTPVIVGAPGEVPLMHDIARRAKGDVVCCDEPPTTLGSLKPLIRDAAVLVCNDTGPRHYGNAFEVPTVTIFGPTHQAWTDTGYSGETKLQAHVECGPCQLRTCPIDHRCMQRVTTSMVVDAAGSLLARRLVSA